MIAEPDNAGEAEVAPVEQIEQAQDESPNANETANDNFSGRKLLSIEEPLENYFNPLKSRLLKVPTFKAAIVDGAGRSFEEFN